MRGKPKGLVYIAGSYRAESNWDLEANIRRAESYILPIAELGLVPVCVHSMYRFHHRTMDAQYWIDATMQIMRACDAVAVVEQSDQSEGTCGEVLEANKTTMPVFWLPEELQEIAKWAKLI